jgi:alpha(1,3/1,4) fucosyltransferase
LNIYIDPAYKAYYQDRLFDENDSVLNRDDTLAPFVRVRDALLKDGHNVHTADYLLAHNEGEQSGDYYSFGVLENYQLVSKIPGLRMRAFVIYEPPVVAPHLYRELPQLTKAFERVYIHNTDGDGYDLNGVDTSRLKKFYWPQPRSEVVQAFWNIEDRLRRIVVINGNHKPISSNNELYSKRIEAIVSLSRFNFIDLYGRGWERWWSRNSMWLPYLCNRRSLMSVYKGSCLSKYEVLGKYEFALCFENMSMKGYVTEKIFDCFYAGAIPLYWGSSDINELIPENAYIDVRNFKSWKDLYLFLMSMSDTEIQSIRSAGRAFLQSNQGLKYFNGLNLIFGIQD